MNGCPVNPAREDIADFIYRQGTSSLQVLEMQNRILCYDFSSREYAVIYLPLSEVLPITLGKYEYYSIPKLYTLLDTSSMEASGILPVFSQPALANQGEGVLIGFIDTGIDYQNPLFRNPDGTTRIAGIWDQTLPENQEELPLGVQDPSGLLGSISYGTTFRPEQINQALKSEDPLSLVPSQDELGHGTFLAGIAAGGETSSGDFIGAAPKASIGVVKLKPAKQYLRDFYLIRPDAPAYQENDIMMGIKYLQLLSQETSMPLVICISLGTNWGSHQGSSPLSSALETASRYTGTVNVIAAGNETGLSHHYSHYLSDRQEWEDVEIRVASGERGFVAELWSDVAELYTIGFISPSGETVSRIPLTLGQDSRVTFLLEKTVITLSYLPAESGSGRQLIFFRFQDPAPGIWRVRVYNTLYLRGQYHMWLPVQGFASPETIFLKPDPDTTITCPGNTALPITVGAYDHRDGSIYLHSSRGFAIDGQIKPDLAAPGVEVFGPSSQLLPDGAPYLTRRTGTSVAAAHTAGAAASLLSWGIVEGNDPAMNSASVRGYLVRGADRSPAYTYPNREFGYGTLNLYQSFLQLRE
ncbi:MAG TPA: S8 family peptidase [Candidatus Cottocaccamicrobium excrementipullorum]|nr:S8 family peptidase [Candidatus Cottocaccamicrobium excrementipullorum]